MNHASTDTRTPARLAAAAAILFAICFFATVASVNVPHDASDAELLAWWQKDANVMSGLVSMGFAIATAVLFAVVTGHLGALVGDRSPRLLAFARTMAISFTATMLVSGALRGVVGQLVEVNGGPLPGIDVLRYTTALNYAVLGVVVMASFALAVIAFGVLALRTGILPRWAAVVGVGCGAVTLAAVVALIGAFTVPIAMLWALGTAIAVLRAPAATAEVESRDPVGTMAS